MKTERLARGLAIAATHNRVSYIGTMVVDTDELRDGATALELLPRIKQVLEDLLDGVGVTPETLEVLDQLGDLQ